MKGIFVGLIVVGGVALVGGAALFAYGLYKNKGNDEFLTHDHTFEENIDDIDINLNTSNLEFKKAEDDKVKVVCVEKEKVYHTAEVKDNKLTIKQVDDRKWYQKYILNFNFKSTSVTVYLPEASYNDLTIDNDTGKIVINKDFSFANIDLQNDTGDVKIYSDVTNNLKATVHTGNVLIDGIKAKNINGKSSTGDFNLKNIEVEEKIELNASTGDVNLNNVKAKDFISKTSTGHAELSDTVVENEMRIKTSTGHVRFDKSDAKTIDVETSTGSVKGTLLTKKIFDAKSDTGSVKTPSASEMIDATGTCTIRTSTGEIKVSIA